MAEGELDSQLDVQDGRVQGVFTAVNDTAGYAAGDRTLVEVAGRLSRSLRPGDTVARLAGDKFVVVCDGVDDAVAATIIAERLLSVVRAPYVHSGDVFAVTASVGVALSGEVIDSEQLLGDAEQAMHQGKNAGAGRVHLGVHRGRPPMS